MAFDEVTTKQEDYILTETEKCDLARQVKSRLSKKFNYKVNVSANPANERQITVWSVAQDKINKAQEVLMEYAEMYSDLSIDVSFRPKDSWAGSAREKSESELALKKQKKIYGSAIIQNQFGEKIVVDNEASDETPNILFLYNKYNSRATGDKEFLNKVSQTYGMGLKFSSKFKLVVPPDLKPISPELNKPIIV